MSKHKPATPRSTSTPMTQPAARRIQINTDKNPNPSPVQQGFKSRAMSTAAKK